MLYTQQTLLPSSYIHKQLETFLLEDKINNDYSTQFSLEKNHQSKGELIAEQESIFVGKHIVQQAYSDCAIHQCMNDGTLINRGDKICSFEGNSTYILSRERVVLNLIQRLSGIAHLTKQYTGRIKGSKIKILDTRKTTPGLRLFEKYAVTQGGGFNHRLNLEHGIMIKDNHLTCITNLSDIINNIRRKFPMKPIQIEIDTINQLYQMLELDIDAVLLDNMDQHKTLDCVQYIRQHEKRHKIFIESSGGVNLNNIHLYIDTGVDGISIGALTHQAVSTNIKLELSNVTS